MSGVEGRVTQDRITTFPIYRDGYPFTIREVHPHTDEQLFGMVTLRGESGDVIVADIDGVCVVRREDAAEVLKKGLEREANETAKRARLAAGELGLDIYGMREALAAKGLVYEDYAASQEHTE